MSGHSKWAQIKRQKAVTDAKKGQTFGKIAKMISVAARKGDNPAMNADLRAAVEKARAVNMPQDNIERAIKKVSGKTGEAALESARFEAYGPGGCAIIIEAITDNTNRTVAEIKHILSKHGAKLAATGSVTWAFKRADGKWTAATPLKLSDNDLETFDKLMEELDDHDDVQEIYSNAE